MDRSDYDSKKMHNNFIFMVLHRMMKYEQNGYSVAKIYKFIDPQRPSKAPKNYKFHNVPIHYPTGPHKAAASEAQAGEEEALERLLQQRGHHQRSAHAAHGKCYSCFFSIQTTIAVSFALP